MASRDPEDKRRRLLEAGLVEFAAAGIGGARMERIAKRAGCSAGLAYSYFANKEALFDAVFAAIVDQVVTEAPITADDLPGYAVRLFDLHEAHPTELRFIAWYQLERGSAAQPPAVLEASAAKVAAIRAAQRAGTVSDRFDAEQTLALVLATVSMYSLLSPEAVAAALPAEQRRATVEAAVRRLVEP